MRILVTVVVKEGNRVLHGWLGVLWVGTYNIQHVFWCDRNMKACTSHWLWSVPPALPRSLPCSTPRCSSIEWHWKWGQELINQKGGLEWANLFAPISAHCPVIPPNDRSLWGLYMQEVPRSVNYDWFTVLLEDCLYHPLPSMTFLRPLNRALQSIDLHKRRKILWLLWNWPHALSFLAKISLGRLRSTGKPVSGLNKW